MIHVEDLGAHGRVRLVTIDRQERRNALDHAALEGLLAAVEGAPRTTAIRGDSGAEEAGGRRDATRVLVLRGAGGHFCAGADLSGVEDPTFVALLNRVLEGLRDAPFPTIAAVDGAALGAGTQLAIACDLRTAAADATFGIPAAKLGLMVDQWTIQRLATIAGQGPARAMLLAALTYTGAEAFGFGMVQKVGPVDDTLAWAEQLAQLAPLTIAGHKVGLNETERGAGLPADGPTPIYQAVFARAWGSEDLQEGLAAFRERRPADFQGR
jgi:enoyl-CoA hydratase